MRVLITGGSGFLGAWITTRLLARGVQVRSFDQRADATLVTQLCGQDMVAELEWHIGDIADAEQLNIATQDCDLIMHLAAVLTPACQADPIRGAHINLLGTLNVFEAAKQHGHRRVLYMSSAGVFGPHDGATPNPTTHYGAFKLANEGCARAYWEDHKIASVGFRPLVVYGPGREVGLTAAPTLACKAIANNENFSIDFSGESDFVYVDDVAAAFDIAMSSDLVGADVFNIVGELATLERLASMIQTHATQSVVSVTGQPIPVCAHMLENGLYERFPQLKKTSLTQGLAATVAHYRNH